MATPKVQVAAMISTETKADLERYARDRGLDEGDVIDAALRHHLTALEALPAEVIIPPRLVVSRRTGEALCARISEADRQS